jgi:hypothetical protein
MVVDVRLATGLVTENVRLVMESGKRWSHIVFSALGLVAVRAVMALGVRLGLS